MAQPPLDMPQEQEWWLHIYQSGKRAREAADPHAHQQEGHATAPTPPPLQGHTLRTRMHKKHGHAHATAQAAVALPVQIAKTSGQPPLGQGHSINDDSKLRLGHTNPLLLPQQDKARHLQPNLAQPHGAHNATAVRLPTRLVCTRAPAIAQNSTQVVAGAHSVGLSHQNTAWACVAGNTAHTHTHTHAHAHAHNPTHPPTHTHTHTAVATERQRLALLYLALYPVCLQTHTMRSACVCTCQRGRHAQIKPEQQAEPSVFVHSVSDIYGYAVLAMVPTGWLAGWLVHGPRRPAIPNGAQTCTSGKKMHGDKLRHTRGVGSTRG